ncbi:MAG TPA: gas vesicle protein GvpJ [Thermodesulfovibrionales bacterium]|nr:gas vesicle protein GvpJ [Thermodesulfovibrionales bacterium]HLA00482.1 gas vesicle protein GvpJ [Thermodesulfovibrionales bacterium]
MTTQIVHGVQTTSLADILERVLDKGIVIAGDIKICIGDVELLDIKIRLIVASVDKAMQMGINWWQTDSYLSSEARQTQIEKENKTLKERLEELEAKLSLRVP